MEYETDQVLKVESGLYGFPGETDFLLLEVSSLRPLAFLQSIGTAGLCFLGIPAQVVDPAYQLSLGPDELASLGLRSGDNPVMGIDLLCLALLCTDEHHDATVNLQAPIVIHIARHCGVQAIQGPHYSHQHPFETRALSSVC